MLSSRFLRFAFLLPALALLTAACARKSEPAPAAAPSEEAAAAAPPAAVPEAPAPGVRAFAFTEADLDAFERGLAKEIELVKAARARGDAARTPEERGLAARARFKDRTAPEAARSIGVDPVRYRATRDTVARVLTTLDFQGKIDGPMEMNMELASPEMKARLASDPYAELSPASAAALRARLDRLVPLWVGYINLTAVAG
ncbi:MAG: hypothetical protein ABR576_12270 [Thermoanaerobaculia bacterium]